MVLLSTKVTVTAMKGVGPSIGPRIIAEIGDPRRFHSSVALIANSGIDTSPYQSGKQHLKLLVNKALIKVRKLFGLFYRGKMEQQK